MCKKKGSELFSSFTASFLLHPLQLIYNRFKSPDRLFDLAFCGGDFVLDHPVYEKAVEEIICEGEKITDVKI